MSYISCTWSLCGSAGGEVRASTLTDPQFLSSRIKSVLAKITENFWSPTVQVFHEWFSSSFLPQSKIMPVRLIGHSKLALGLIVWEKFVCFLWWPPVQGVFLPFTQWLLGQSPAPTVTLIGTKQWLIEIGWTDGWKSYATGIPPASRRWPSMGWGFGSGAEITWLWTCIDAEPPRCWGIGCHQTHQLKINVNPRCVYFVLVESSTVFLLNTDLLTRVLTHNLTLIIWILAKSAW